MLIHAVATAKPSIADAAHIARTHFGIDGTATPLAGEFDHNFHIDTGGCAYVLKIMRADCDRAFIEMQIEARGEGHHLVWMNQGVPVELTAPISNPKALLRAIGLEPDDVSTELEIAVLSVGNNAIDPGPGYDTVRVEHIAFFSDLPITVAVVQRRG